MNSWSNQTYSTSLKALAWGQLEEQHWRQQRRWRGRMKMFRGFKRRVTGENKSETWTTVWVLSFPVWMWKEFFICLNLLQGLKFSSVELGKLACIAQIKSPLTSVPPEPSPGSCFPTHICFNIQHLTCCVPEPAREVEGFHLPWELLEPFCSWEPRVTTNYTGLLIPNVLYLLRRETCFYLFPYFAFSWTGRLLCIAASIFVALRNCWSNLDKGRPLSGVFYLTIRRGAAWLVLPGFILQSRGGHAAAHRLPVAFAIVCGMPVRNLLKVPVLGSPCLDMCPLCFPLPGLLGLLGWSCTWLWRHRGFAQTWLAYNYFSAAGQPRTARPSPCVRHRAACLRF